MKKTFYFVCLTVMVMWSACSPKPQEKVMVSPNPPSLAKGTFWIIPAKSGTIRTDKGQKEWSNCFIINAGGNIEPNEKGSYDLDSKDFQDNNLWCGQIGNFNYDEGKSYQVKGTMSYLGDKLVSVDVNEVLQTSTVAGAFNKEVTVIEEHEDPNPSGESQEKTKMTKSDEGQAQTEEDKSEEEDLTEIVMIEEHEDPNPSGESPEETQETESEKDEGDTGRDKSEEEDLTEIVMIEEHEDPDPSPPTNDIFWIFPAQEGTSQTDQGVEKWSNCFLINVNNDIGADASSAYDAFSSKDSENELYCGRVGNFDFEYGRVYKVKGAMSYEGGKLANVDVKEILMETDEFGAEEKPEEDPVVKPEEKPQTKTEGKTEVVKTGDDAVPTRLTESTEERTEIVEFYVGPDKVDAKSFHGYDQECLQVMYASRPRSKDWMPYCGLISGMEFEPEYLYKVRVKRTYLSDFELKNSTVEHSYTDHVIALLKKQRVLPIKKEEAQKKNSNM